MKTHRAILGLWPTYAELRRQLLERGHDAAEMLVARWAERNSIPSEWWLLVEDIAEDAGYPVNLRLLALTAPNVRKAKGSARARG